MNILSSKFEIIIYTASVHIRRTFSRTKARRLKFFLPLMQMNDEMQDQIELIRKNVKSYQNFPKQGVLFRDIFSVLQEPKAFAALKDVLVSVTKTEYPEVECVVGLDARGFLFGPLISLEQSVPFVPVRKKGKLPGEVLTECYCLEYGEDTLQMQKDSVTPGMKVLLIDDLLATGGSLKATCALIEQAGATVLGCIVIMELMELKGRENVPAPIHSILQY